jgi:hypothetical protein
MQKVPTSKPNRILSLLSILTFFGGSYSLLTSPLHAKDYCQCQASIPAPGYTFNLSRRDWDVTCDAVCKNTYSTISGAIIAATNPPICQCTAAAIPLGNLGSTSGMGTDATCSTWCQQNITVSGIKVVGP